MARKAVIGPQIVAAVDKLETEGLNKTAAFKTIAENPKEYGVEMTGTAAGTVAASYYRVKRQQNTQGNATAKPKPASGNTSGNGNGRKARATSKAGDIDALVNDLVASVEAVADAVRTQAANQAKLEEKLRAITAAFS